MQDSDGGSLSRIAKYPIDLFSFPSISNSSLKCIDSSIDERTYFQAIRRVTLLPRRNRYHMPVKWSFNDTENTFQQGQNQKRKKKCKTKRREETKQPPEMWRLCGTCATRIPLGILEKQARGQRVRHPRPTGRGERLLPCGVPATVGAGLPHHP